MRMRYRVCTFVLGGLSLGADLSSAQVFPHKPIRLVCAEPGGGNDLVARVLAQGLSPALGQPIIVDNRGRTEVEIVAKAPADGYTLLVNATSFWIVPLMKKTFYDPEKDFSPITAAVSSPNSVVVHPSVPVSSVKELIALAKAKPGSLNYGSGLPGSSNHLAGELFRVMTGIDILRIDFKGSGPALNAMLGGELQIMFPTVTSVMPYVKSGRLKALAVSSAEPSTLAPGWPTVTASGLPGYEAGTKINVFAPVKTPAAVVARLNHEILKFLQTSAAKERLFSLGVEPVGSSPEQLAAIMRSDMAKMSKVLKSAGIQVE